MHESQQTTPRATPRAATHHRHIQTDIHAIVQLPSFAGLISTADSTQSATFPPTASSTFPTASPNPTSATNKQPHDRWQYVNLIPTPTVTLPEQPHTPPTFPSPIGGTPRNRRSKTPPRTTTPTRTRQPDPRTGSPTPKAAPPASTATLPLQSTRFQSDLHHLSLKPYSIILPPNPFSLYPRQLAGRAFKADLTRLHPPWHHQQSLPRPRTHGQHIIPFQHSNPPLSSHHRLAPPPWVHHPQWSCSTHPRPGWTRRGAPCRCHNRTMTQLPTRGMQTTIDHAAAASEAPVMISPRMIHTITFPTLTPSIVFLCRLGFYRGFPPTCPPSSSDIGPAYSADQHAQFHFAQRKNSALQGTVGY